MRRFPPTASDSLPELIALERVVWSGLGIVFYSNKKDMKKGQKLDSLKTHSLNSLEWHLETSSR